jgi:chromosome segregation ATPase
MQAEENRQNGEKEEAMSEEHTRLLQEAAELDGELQRIRATNATRLDALSRKLHSSRGNMLDRERTLDDLVAKNTQLQSTIIEYEEAKRRMEREALQKKESAARAAKTALKDLE